MSVAESDVEKLRLALQFLLACEVNFAARAGGQQCTEAQEENKKRSTRKLLIHQRLSLMPS
jgi:hypothetical protein